MANLKTLQTYANKCADKLELPEHPILRWHTKADQYKMATRIYAHCHIRDTNGFPRGTICLHKGIPIWHKVSWWHNTIAHEVTHLAVKSSHSSTTFARRMVNLGVANYTEKRLVKATKKHHHIYSVYELYRGVHHWYCDVCLKERRSKKEMAYQYVDHLTEYMKEKAARLISDHRDSLPQELADLPDDRIIALITEMATPILRKMEDDAITAGIERVAGLIRYSQKQSRKS